MSKGSIRKFGRERDQRRALIRSLAEALAKRGKIKTTQARAKELRPYAEKLVTLARKNNLASKRLLIRRLGTAQRAKYFEKVASNYKERAGGYTRVVKLPPRKSDGARMAFIEFV